MSEKDTLLRIKTGYITGFLVAGVSFLFFIIVLPRFFNHIALASAIVITILSVGVMFKSKIAAIALFSFYLFTKLTDYSFLIISGGQPEIFSLGVTGLVLFLLFQGIVGTFRYSKIDSTKKETKNITKVSDSEMSKEYNPKEIRYNNDLPPIYFPEKRTPFQEILILLHQKL